MKRIILNLSLIAFLGNVYAQNPLTIEKQGVFAVGGSVITAPGSYDPMKPATGGQSLHVDHATVRYQIPQNAKKLPLVFWHGFGQTARTWQTTADGREGFQSIFLRKNYPVYLIDQPRRGQGGPSPETATIAATPSDQYWLGMFRIAKAEQFLPGVRFDKKDETLNQFLRQISPDLGSIDFEVNTNAVSALFDKIGEGILVSHSHSGGQGWTTAMKNPNIKAIVSYEPGSGFVFPEGEVPPPISGAGGVLKATAVSKGDFLKLTKIPIIIYYGDFIPETPSDFYGTDNWRTRLEMAKRFAKAINKYGGDAKVVHLPEIGIKGNTHFPMSDLNNKEIAELMANWLKEKGLNQHDTPHPETEKEHVHYRYSENPFGLVYEGAISENLKGKVNIHPVSYQLDGLNIAANVYTPANFDSHKKYPAIVIAHPNGGVKEQVAGLYAQKLSELGYIAIAADAAYQGASSGTPRNTDEPANRIKDIHGMADFISQYKGVDKNKIGLLGICGGGGYALKAAQSDKRFKALATLSMFNTGEVRRNGFLKSQTSSTWERLKQAQQAKEQEARGDEVLYVNGGTPSLSNEQIAALPFELYREGYIYYNKTHAHPNSGGGYTMSSLLKLMNWDATDGIERINQALLMIAGSKADSYYMTDKAFEKASNARSKELFLIEGASHIQTYRKPKYVKQAVNQLNAFYKTQL